MSLTYRVILSSRVAGELEAIFAYVAQQSPQNAGLVVHRVLEALDSLKTMPRRFSIERRARRPGYDVHRMVVLTFRVFYRIVEAQKVVRVLSIRHGAQRRPRSFE